MVMGDIKFAVCLSVYDASSPKLLKGLSLTLHRHGGLSQTYGGDRHNGPVPPWDCVSLH